MLAAQHDDDDISKCTPPKKMSYHEANIFDSLRKKYSDDLEQ